MDFEYTGENYIGLVNVCKHYKIYYQNGNLRGEGVGKGEEEGTQENPDEWKKGDA